MKALKLAVTLVIIVHISATILLVINKGELFGNSEQVSIFLNGAGQ